MGATIQTIVLTLLLIVLLYDLLTSRKTRYVITYEYMDITLSTKEDGEVISFEPLSERDARGNYLPCVKLTLKSGRELILANRMQDIKERFGFKTSSI